MSTKLIFRSGLKTIGGTIAELIHNNERIIFDFGTFFDPASSDEVIPSVEGVFNDDSKYNDSIFISHLHLDHTKAMNLVNKTIPIYMSMESKEFLDDLYKIDFNGFLGEKREYTGLKDKESIDINGIKATMLKVDHDVLGSAAILFETEDLTLFYSGDIRLHGLNSKYTYDMIDYIKNLGKDIDVAIFEGVTISFIEDDFEIIPTNESSEEQLEENFAKVITEKRENDGLILANPYIMSYERVVSIFSLAKELERVVCLNSEFAYLANKYLSEEDYLIIDEDKYNIGKEIVSYEELTDSHIALFDYNSKEKYLNAIKKSNTTLLQTGGEPLGAYDPRWEVLEQFCEENKIELIAYGASGHAAPEHLLYIVEEINPNILMPLHSFKPELLKSKKENIKQILPKEDVEYIFENHKLISN